MVMEVVMSDLVVMAMLVEFDVVMEMRMAASWLVIEKFDVLRPHERRREQHDGAQTRDRKYSNSSCPLHESAPPPNDVTKRLYKTRVKSDTRFK